MLIVIDFGDFEVDKEETLQGRFCWAGGILVGQFWGWVYFGVQVV